MKLYWKRNCYPCKIVMRFLRGEDFEVDFIEVVEHFDTRTYTILETGEKASIPAVPALVEQDKIIIGIGIIGYLKSKYNLVERGKKLCGFNKKMCIQKSCEFWKEMNSFFIDKEGRRSLVIEGACAISWFPILLSEVSEKLSLRSNGRQ